MQDIRRFASSYKQDAPIAFRGLLTNKVLTSLPGPVFAAMLPHLEPTTVTAGQEIYSCGAKIETVYFPESAVLSQLSYLDDGSATEVAIIGNEGLVGLSALLDSSCST